MEIPQTCLLHMPHLSKCLLHFQLSISSTLSISFHVFKLIFHCINYSADTVCENYCPWFKGRQSKLPLLYCESETKFNSGCSGSSLILWLYPLYFRNPMQLFTNNGLCAKILQDWLKEIPIVFLILISLLAFKCLKKGEPNPSQYFCPSFTRIKKYKRKKGF